MPGGLAGRPLATVLQIPHQPEPDYGPGASRDRSIACRNPAVVLSSASRRTRVQFPIAIARKCRACVRLDGGAIVPRGQQRFEYHRHDHHLRAGAGGRHDGCTAKQPSRSAGGGPGDGPGGADLGKLHGEHGPCRFGYAGIHHRFDRDVPRGIDADYRDAIAGMSGRHHIVEHDDPCGECCRYRDFDCSRATRRSDGQPREQQYGGAGGRVGEGGARAGCGDVSGNGWPNSRGWSGGYLRIGAELQFRSRCHHHIAVIGALRRFGRSFVRDGNGRRGDKWDRDPERAGPGRRRNDSAAEQQCRASGHWRRSRAGGPCGGDLYGERGSGE